MQKCRLISKPEAGLFQKIAPFLLKGHSQVVQDLGKLTLVKSAQSSSKGYENASFKVTRFIVNSSCHLLPSSDVFQALLMQELHF